MIWKKLTWNILDDLPILDGRSHLEDWCSIVASWRQSQLPMVSQVLESISSSRMYVDLSDSDDAALFIL